MGKILLASLWLRLFFIQLMKRERYALRERLTLAKRMADAAVLIGKGPPYRRLWWMGVFLLLSVLSVASAAWAQVGQIPLAVVPTPKTAFFMATNGNDGNSGTIGSPFATLGKCQTAMEGSGTKTCYIRAGFYSSPVAMVGGCNNGGSPANIVQLTHAKGDDGETFSYYPPDGIGNVIFDGGGTIPTAFCAYHVKNLTVTGLTFQHFAQAPLYLANWDANDGNGTGDTFSGNTVLNSVPGGGNPAINCAGWVENARITNNLIENVGGQGIGCSTTQASAVGGLTGLTVSLNVVFNSCMAQTDCGGIYFQDYQLPVSTGITNTNNYIYQVNAASAGGNCIYHDDGASNVTSTGNVCVAGGSLTACWLIHGGSNDVLTGNICDEGDGSEILRYQQTTHTPASFPMTGNSITANDITCRAVGNCGLGYRGLSPVAPAPETNHGNTYWNFTTSSGAVVSAGGGGANGDSGPIAANPGLICPSGFSTAWGPPGFVLPAVLPGPPPSWCSGTKGVNPTGGGWLTMTSLSAPTLAAVVADFQALGLNWIRYELDAPTIDPTCGSMTWGNNDAVIAALHNAGLKVMALVNEASGCMNGSGPATQGPTTSGGRASWATFAQAVAQRYGATGTAVRGGIQAYEIWNEPNCAVFWTPSADPVNFEALMVSANAAIKAADPAAIVVTGGLSPCGTSGTTQSMMKFTANLYAAGLKGNENAIGIHPYCASPVGTAGCDNIRKMYDTSFLPGAGSTCLAANTPDSCTILSIMTEYGDGAEQIWSTEFGMGTSQQAGAANVDQTQQAADVASFASLMNTYSGTWAGPWIWYNYQDFVVAHGTGPDGKPQCTAADDPPGNLCFGLELYSATGVGAAKLAYAAMVQAPPASTAGNEEFVGPFTTWLCAKSSGSGSCGAAAGGFGTAAGDGVTNDISAIQASLNALANAHPILWFPAGTYLVAEISATATASSGSTAMTVSGASGTIVQGMAVWCANVPQGDWVASISGSSVTLGQNTSGPVSGTCLFGLDLRNVQNMGLVGHDPSDTTIKWVGSSGGTMLLVDGTARSVFQRFTFNGNSLAGKLVDQSALSGTGLFDTANQYADDVFENGGPSISWGLRCGGNSPGGAVNGCSETEIIRSHFSSLTIGFGPCNGNAVDEWIWYSTFANNQYAVTNNTNVPLSDPSCYAGDYHAIDNNFSGSTASDFYSHGSGQFNLIGNYSSGSNQFLNSLGVFLLQKNTILDTTLSASFQNGEGFPIALIDNKIRTKSGNTVPVVSATQGKLISIGNTFTVGTTGTVESGFNIVYQLDDSIGTVTASPPALPGTPPNFGRAIYEASPTGTNNGTCSAGSPCTMQAAVCVAATGSNAFSAGCTGTVNTNRAVVHVQAGNYTITSPILVPANSNIQIIGDGGWSTLLGGVAATPVIGITGPSYVALRNFHISADHGADAIAATGVDQAGAVIYIDDATSSSIQLGALYSDGLNNALIETHDINLNSGGASSAGVIQTGGNQVNLFLGSSTLLHSYFSLSGGAKLETVGVWNDGSRSESVTYATVAGSGSFADINANNALVTSALYAISSGYSGKFVSLLSRAVPLCPYTVGGEINISGTQTGAQELIAGKVMQPTTFNNTATGNQTDFFANLANICTSPSNIADSFTNISGTLDATFLRSALAPYRANGPIFPQALGAGISNIQVYRVITENARYGFHFSP